MANNLILAISFGFKLNNNLNPIPPVGRGGGGGREAESARADLNFCELS